MKKQLIKSPWATAKKVTKKIALDHSQVYVYYKQCLKEGKGATTIAAVASKFRINNDMAWIAIKESQDAELKKLIAANEKEKDPVKKATQSQILELTSLKSSNDLAKHKTTTQIRVNKFAAFAHTATQQLDLKRQAFRNYIEINLGYIKSDANILVRIFNNEINSDNIEYYITRTAREIYLGILNENLDTLADFKPAEWEGHGLPLIHKYRNQLLTKKSK